MQLKLYQVDAFADALFGGNPAAVCPLDHWLDDALMQRIAQENNLSETAFFRVTEHPITIRWFTPITEVELCGHATLAAAHVLSKHLGYRHNPMHFQSLSGPLSVIAEEDDHYTLDFPVDKIHSIETSHPYLTHFNQTILEAWRGTTDFLLVVENEQAVRDLKADFEELAEADGRGFIVTAPGSDCDYVSRCFYPQAGINEDPATGSSQTTLANYWSGRLGKTQFTSRQLSARGARFETEVRADRVLITGKAVSYLEGTISL